MGGIAGQPELRSAFLHALAVDVPAVILDDFPRFAVPHGGLFFPRLRRWGMRGEQRGQRLPRAGVELRRSGFQVLMRFGVIEIICHITLTSMS